MATEFTFHNLDTIGANAAEDDHDYLFDCFVDMPELPVLQNIKDHRYLVIGRTGSGKTALFMRLAKETNNCFLVNADIKGFCYTERSTVLTDLADKGINLAPYLKLLWMHVLNIEVIQNVFPVDQKVSIITQLKSLFVRKSVKEATALKYLEEHQEEFWTDTTEKTKKITEDFIQSYEKQKKTDIDASTKFKEFVSLNGSHAFGDS
jgi:adenylate kinase family enzyme